jgi:hypothetical protein
MTGMAMENVSKRNPAQLLNIFVIGHAAGIPANSELLMTFSLLIKRQFRFSRCKKSAVESSIPPLTGRKRNHDDLTEDAGGEGWDGVMVHVEDVQKGYWILNEGVQSVSSAHSDSSVF